MRRYDRVGEERKSVFVGIGLHRLRWQVTIRTENVELFSGSIPGRWEALQRLLERYRQYANHVVYEAGYFEFKLHDRLEEWSSFEISDLSGSRLFELGRSMNWPGAYVNV